MTLIVNLISILLIASFANGQNSFTCPSYSYSYVSYPDIANCQGYWQCRYGSATRQRCPLATYFNSRTQLCESPNRPQCVLCHDTGFYIVKVNCKEYRLCVHGAVIPQRCLDGTYFDDSVGDCVLVPEGEDECPFVPCVNAGNGVTFQRNPKKCEEYYICDNEKVLLKRNCSAGTWFGTQTCEPQIPSGCLNALATPAPRSFDLPRTTECPSKGAAVIPVEGDCTKYSVCSNGKVIEERSCSEGLHFSAQSGVCAHPEDAFCPDV